MSVTSAAEGRILGGLSGKIGSDTSVQGTNDDAQVSKLSCATAGYFKDDFIRLFVRRPSRRSPLINRGYFARFASIRKLLIQFLHLSNDCPKQVIQLGAGFDSTWFNLAAEGLTPSKYIELDFPEVTKRKIASIKAHSKLSSMMQVDANSISSTPKLCTERYSIMPADLRNLQQVKAALDEAKIDMQLPTMIISECVLVYMDPEYSRDLVAWLGTHFPSAAMLVYEQINPDDAFGKQMISNLEMRGCPLKGITATPTLQDHKNRFLHNNWQRATAATMDTIYCQFIDAAERQRIEKLEIFDEYEEWHLIQEHYCLTVGVNDNEGIFAQFGFLE